MKHGQFNSLSSYIRCIFVLNNINLLGERKKSHNFAYKLNNPKGMNGLKVIKERTLRVVFFYVQISQIYWSEETQPERPRWVYYALVVNVIKH